RFRLYQSGASAQATEHVEDRHVVVQRSDRDEYIVRGDLPCLERAADDIGRGPVVEHHAFGLAGRPRGVEVVGRRQVLGASDPGGAANMVVGRRQPRRWCDSGVVRLEPVCTDDQVRSAVLQQIVQPLYGGATVYRYPYHAAQGAGQGGHSVLRAAGQTDGDDLACRDPRSFERPHDPQDAVAESAMADAAIPLYQGNLVIAGIEKMRRHTLEEGVFVCPCLVTVMAIV